MAGTVNIALALERHPESSAPALSRVDARVLRTPEGVLGVTYTLEGDLDKLRFSLLRQIESCEQ